MTTKIERMKDGDKIAIVNVAAPEPAEFPDRVSIGIKKLEHMGFQIIEAEHLMSNDGVFSASPEIIAREFNDLWSCDDVKAIICAGGGIAANVLLPHLDYKLFSRLPKPLIGASNPTILLNAIAKKSGIPTYHGPSIVWDFGDEEQPQFTIDNFGEFFLRNGMTLGEIPEFLVEGDAKGRSFGGNLSSLLLLAGTDYFPDYMGGVLFWEDIGESSDRILAKLTQLDEMGVLQSLNGMIVGELVDCNSKAGLSCREAVLKVCSKYGYPIGWSLPFGHTPRKVIVPIGAAIHFSSDSRQLSVTERV